MTRTKKVNPKTVAKKNITEKVADYLKSEGYDVTVNADEVYGFTAGTIVVHDEVCDIQLKPIAPKTNVTRYEELGDE